MDESIEGSAEESAAGVKVQRLPLAPVEAPDPRAGHTFDNTGRMLSELFADYVRDSVSIELIAHGREGVNLDVGEILEFDIRIENHGAVNLADVSIRVVARRGGLSQMITGSGTYRDPEAERCVIEWIAPWVATLDLAAHRLGAGQAFQGTVPPFLGGLASCRRVFAYRPHQPTGGVDNDRDVETLVTAQIASGRFGDIDPVEVEEGPVGEFESFVQRS